MDGPDYELSTNLSSVQGKEKLIFLRIKLQMAHGVDFSFLCLLFLISSQ